MHWHAIRQSAGSRECRDTPTYGNPSQQLHLSPIRGEDRDVPGRMLSLPQGQDDTQDAKPTLEPPALICEPGDSLQTSFATDESHSIADEDSYLQVPIPTFSTGLTTFAYQRALRNRVRDFKLAKHGEFDMRAYTPTFVHDCLMLPGSLANVLGKASAEDVTNRMTPALLPGFCAHVDSEDHEPCLLQSTDQNHYVQGMVIFGQGRKGRDQIHKHYRPYARRVKVQVQIDVQVHVSSPEHDFPFDGWQLQRRIIWAHAWLWSDIATIDTSPGKPMWTLEDYLAGNYDADQGLRVDPTGSGNHCGSNQSSIEQDEDVREYNKHKKSRSLVYGGSGNLDYIRRDVFTGW